MNLHGHYVAAVVLPVVAAVPFWLVLIVSSRSAAERLLFSGPPQWLHALVLFVAPLLRAANAPAAALPLVVPPVYALIPASDPIFVGLPSHPMLR